MDDLPPDLERLFEQEEQDLEPPAGLARCQCGNLFILGFPLRCNGCGKAKAFWHTADKKIISLGQMTVGHLTSVIKLLAEQSEQYPASQRERFEIALDILYAELGSRDKEIKQLGGIQAALFRGVDRK
jgi:hypothetical protein